MNTFKQIVIFFIGLVIGMILLDWGFSWLSASDSLLNICGVFIVCFGFFSIVLGIFPNMLKKKERINREEE